MKKPIMVYLIVFVASFLVINAIMYFLLKGKISKLAPVPSDSLATAMVDSVQTKPESAPDSLKEKTSDIPDPETEFESLMRLKKNLIRVYSGDVISDYTATEIDSMLENFVNQIDTLAFKQQRYIRRINKQYGDMQNKEQDNEDLRQRITELEANIDSLHLEENNRVEAETQVETASNIQFLVDTYNTMDTKKVAQLMLPQSDSQIILMLRRMNQRKAGKILESLPANRASLIIKKMMQPEKKKVKEETNATKTENEDENAN